MIKEHNQVVVFLMGACDLAVTAGAWGAVYWLRFHSGWMSFTEPHPPGISYILQATVVTLLLAMLIFGRCGLYRPRRIGSMIPEFGLIIQACGIVWLMEVGICHFLHNPRMSAAIQGMFLVFWPVALISVRGSARVFLRSARKRGKNLRTVAIVGSGRLGQKLLHTLREQQWMGYRIRYFVEDRRIGGRLDGVPVRGPINNIDTILQHRPVDAVFIALGARQSDRLNEVLAKTTSQTVDLYIVPDYLNCHFLRQQVRQIGQLPLVGLTDTAQGGLGGVAKRVMDIAISSMALVGLTPLMLVIAFVIKITSPGAVFYRQRRAGLGSRSFNMIKFRTMYVHHDLGARGQWGTARNDPRVTTVGKWLRRLSLDELPQLINVLLGEMSLIGPRPERPEFIKRFQKQIPRYMLRHHVKAGLTGWAQVNGYRGQTSLRKRVQYDLDYINRWSLSFDIYILTLTVVRGFFNAQE